MVLTHDSSGALDSPLPLGDRCACGNIFMTDAVFCRKCGCKRGNQEIEDNDQVNRWDLFLEVNQGSLSNKADEPRTLEVAYSLDRGQVSHEIVYEDPTETEKRPRLLVSLQSVLALKALCEREFDRVEIITEVLKKCRTAYYKELCYLREQLERLARPQLMVDHVYNFEVYWFEPQEYIDHDLKLFLQECIRMTNKKLIEENYELVQRLKAMGANSSGGTDDDHIKRMIRTLGPGNVVRKLYGFLLTPEHGSEQKRKDFEMAVTDIMKKNAKDEGNNAELEAEIKKLLEENKKLKKAAEDAENYKKRISELEKEVTALGRGGQQAASIEAARADMEKARADEAQVKVESLENELDKMRKALKDAQDKEKTQGQAVKRLSQKIDVVSQKLDSNAKPPMAGEGVLGPIESSVSTLEGCLPGVLGRLNNGTAGSQADKQLIQNLEAQMKAAADRDAKYKLDIERLQREAKKLKEERDAEALAAAQANARVQAALKGGGSSAEEESLREQLQNAHDEIERRKAELEKNEKDYYEKIKSLELKLQEAEEQCRKYKDIANSGNGKGGALEEVEKALAEMAERYERAQMKIGDLKDQIKRLKAQLGLPPDDDSDSDDSNYDGEMPMFLMSYVKRTRSLFKPRWKHLSDDAKFARQKRDFLYAQAHANTRESLGEAADEAFNFLRQKENRRGSALSQRSISTKSLGRAKTASFDLDNDPVSKALQAQRSASTEFFQDPEVLQTASCSTGHPLDIFTSLSQRQNPSLEAAVAISATVLERPGTGQGSKPGSASEEKAKRSKKASVSSSSEHFPEPPSNSQQQQVLQEIPTQMYSQSVQTVEQTTYESLLSSGEMRLGSAGSLSRGRVSTPQREAQREISLATLGPPMVITSGSGIEPFPGSPQSSATLRAFDRSRINNIGRLSRSGSRGSPSGSPDRRTQDHFPLSSDPVDDSPIDRGRHRLPLRSGRSFSRPESQASSQSPVSPTVRSTASIGNVAPRRSVPVRNKSDSVSPPPPTQTQESQTGAPVLRKGVPESLVGQSVRRNDAVVEAVEAGTLSSMLSPKKTRSSAPNKSADPFLAEASTSSLGSTAIPAEFSIASSSTSSPSRDRSAPKAPPKLSAKAPNSRSRSMLSNNMPPAGFGSRSKPFPPNNSPSTLDFGCGPATFSPPLGLDSPLARTPQEKLMGSTLPSPSRTSPKALKPRRASTAEQPPPPREVTWGMSISKSMGSLPFTNVKSASTTMSTTSSSMSPTKTKLRSDTGADDLSHKGHLPLLMPDFKPGKVHKGPLGLTGTLYVAI